MKQWMPIALLALCGCSSIPETKYYILSIDDAAIAAGSNDNGEILALGRITLADYLRPSGIVTQTNDHRVHTASYHRWGEPLHRGIRRTLAKQLAADMPHYRIEAAVHDPREPAYQLNVEIERFHADAAGTAILSGRWTLYADQDRTIVASRHFHISDSLAAPGYPAAVSAQTGLLGKLSGQVSAAIGQTIPVASTD